MVTKKAAVSCAIDAQCADYLETFLEILFIIDIKNELKKCCRMFQGIDLAKSPFCSLK